MAIKPVREAVVPVYLFLCLVLGGSAQGIWANAVLQWLALGLLAWAAAAESDDEDGNSIKWLLAICRWGLLMILLQLIPLPPAIWSSLPGRSIITEGYVLLGQPLPWMTLSLAPDETFSTIFRLLPPSAVLAAMLRRKAYRPVWIAWALIAGTCVGVLLGAFQVSSAAGADSSWYLYPISNFGVAVGFFANGNHMALLLVVAIPFIFALLALSRRNAAKPSAQRQAAMRVLASGLILVIMLGLFLNKSLAGLGLGLPVVAASIILLVRPERQRKLLLVPVGVALLALAAFLWLPGTANIQSLGASTSVESRRVVTLKTLQAGEDFMPLGSGLGSFERVYRLYEKPRAIDPTYVNHAHNDYLELALEAGIPAIAWMLAFLVWFGICARSRWYSVLGDPWPKAGTIAAAAIIAHSLVDFPLRTSAIASVFAVAVGLMSQALPGRAEKTDSDFRPRRHLEIS